MAWLRKFNIHGNGIECALATLQSAHCVSSTSNSYWRRGSLNGHLRWVSAWIAIDDDICPFTTCRTPCCSQNNLCKVRICRECWAPKVHSNSLNEFSNTCGNKQTNDCTKKKQQPKTPNSLRLSHSSVVFVRAECCNEIILLLKIAKRKRMHFPAVALAPVPSPCTGLCGE